MDLPATKTLIPLQGCHPAVADGIKHFSAAIELQQSQNTRALSLNSRNSSIRSLLRKYLDIPIDDVIKNYRGTYLRELLDDFRLSRVGQILPRLSIDVPAWLKENEDQNISVDEFCRPLSPRETLDWKNYLTPVRKKSHDKYSSNIRRITQNIRLWEQNLRFVILSIDCSHNDHVSNQERLQFRKTIGSIQTLLSTLELFLPQTGKDPALQLYDGPQPIGIDHHDNFCELCWRKTMRAVELNRIYNSGVNTRHLESTYSLLQEGRDVGFIANALGISTEIAKSNIETIKEIQRARRKPTNNESKEIKYFSDQYCHEHNPTNPTSRYRTDYRYKEAFQWEILALKGLTESRFKFRFPPPPEPDEQEIRKAAYDLVHAGIRPLEQIETPSQLEIMWDFFQNGMTQAEIARELNVQRQAVSRQLKKAIRLLQTRELEQDVCATTQESWHKTIDSYLVQQVINLHRNGHTIAKIADKTNRFKHTIHSILIWLELIPNKSRKKNQHFKLIKTV